MFSSLNYVLTLNINNIGQGRNKVTLVLVKNKTKTHYICYITVTLTGVTRWVIKMLALVLNKFWVNVLNINL